MPLKSKLLVFESEKNFLQALQTLNSRQISHQEILSPLDWREEEIFSDAKKNLNIVKFSALIGALLGLSSGFFLAWYPSVVDAPLNVGGRPLNSWPAFIPLTFVVGVLFSATFGFATFLWRLGFPQLYHRVFEFSSFNLSHQQYYILVPQNLGPDLIQSLAPEKIEEVQE